nr:Gfo/Idh/MocA family oxidoreductase [Ensifer adhaerens]
MECGACGPVARHPSGSRPLCHFLAAADPRHHRRSSQVSSDSKPVRVLVAGLGNMGRSHALAYHNNPGFEIVGLVNRSKVELPEELRGYEIHPDFNTALADLKPELCSVCTYSDSHADYAVAAFEAGCDVFVEKPLATTVADAERVVAAAKKHGRKLIIGYILRHHPSWIRLIAEARKLGGPYVFRMNLNQQSSGPTWETHKSLMQTTPPIVDCGVHYVDVMCQITDAKPVEVRGMGLRLSDEIAEDMYNYGHLQVIFEDGSAGWYEAGWGPMISETAFFVKDVMSPKGSVSIVMDPNAKSDDIDTHTKTSVIRVHTAETGPNGRFLKPDEDLTMDGEPGHQELCDREQAYVLKAIREDINLDRHMNDAVQSLRICLAADESVRSGQPVKL